MSSVSRGPAQVLTKQFVVIATGEAYTQAQIESELGSDYVQIGNVYLLSSAAFTTAIAGGISGIATPTVITAGDSLRDLGKDLYIGIIGGDSQLLQFRLVQPLNGTVANSGVNSAGLYVLVANKVKLGSTVATVNTLPVSVARV